MTLDDLTYKRNKSLRLENRPAIKSYNEIRKFLAEVGMALRYWETKGLPMASLYRAATGTGKKETGQRMAIELTNQLLGSHEAIEVNVIADRLVMVHKSLMPALHRLVTNGNDNPKLSWDAKRAQKLLEEKMQVSAGDVRKLFAAPSGQRDDPAYAALGELQRHLLIDRGPFKVPKGGIPYLSKEGYPYHFFREAHFDIVSESEKLSRTGAADRFLSGYLKGAVVCSVKKMASMFKLFLSSEEIMASCERQQSEKKLVLEAKGKDVIARL